MRSAKLWMGLTLYLIRHAKSSWEVESLDDEERPLAKRGKREAKTMACHLKSQGVALDAVVCSPAKRARATCRRICRALGFERKDVVVKKSLYFDGAEKVLRCMQRLPASCVTVAAFGHNPDWTDFVLACHKRPSSFDELPTCGVAVVSFACDDWADASWENASVLTVVTPKDVDK